jgi:uncharacterized RDD family membrane protein YckC
MKEVYASFWRRSLARLLDLSLVLGICALFYLVNRFLGFPIRYSSLFEARHVDSVDMFMFYDFPGVALTFISVKLFVAYPYFALMESSHWQGTPGKLALGIRVTDLSGNRISFGKATGRYFLKSISTGMLMLGYVISFSNLRQTWHDYIAKTLVLRKDFLPASDVLPRISSRWMFDLPGFVKQQDTDQIGARYMCMFCSHRSNERLQVGGCPHCGTAWPYGEAGALRALQVIAGLVFVVLGGFCLYVSAVALKGIFQGDKIPWGIFAVTFGVGGTFVTGGVSSFLGKSWLFRLLLVFFGVALRRSGPRGKQ